MKATNTSYNFENSLSRIDDILNAGDCNYQDADKMPTRDKLTYTNGYYVDCTAIFVDICGSSDMTDVHKRPVLAKIYRAFISEMVAMFNGYSQCREISINGDCVWAVFDTPLKTDVDSAFDAAAQAHSMIDVLNYKLSKKKYSNIEANIGLDYGRALMVQAGYKGSAINDVIWMGDVVNSACHLCNEERGLFGKIIYLGVDVYNHLCEKYKNLCSKLANRDVYQSGAINVPMNNWLNKQK